MGTLCSEKMYREEMVKELVKGKKFAIQLQGVLQKPFEEDGLVSAEDLVAKILRSFTQALSVLSSSSSGGGSCDDRNNLLQQENSCDVNSDGHWRSEDSRESKKRPALKDRKGCYKRKKNSQAWTTVSSVFDDGYAWRKYGQKDIPNGKYPRSYYRCTHKYAQDCMATKQVQRMDDDPQKYEITYIGIHTCTHKFVQDCGATKQVQRMDDDPQKYEIKDFGNHTWSDLISFPQIVTENSVVSLSSVKQEYKEETTSTDHNLSSWNSIMWEDFVPFQSSYEPEEVAAMVLSAWICLLILCMGFNFMTSFRGSCKVYRMSKGVRYGGKKI